MTNENWKNLEAAFAIAIELNGDEREAMLVEFAEQHPELEQQLRDLLTADSNDDEQLQQPIANVAQAMADTAEDPWIDRKIGAWSIKSRIAEGGMGAVFLAERSDEEYEQTVALKVMTAQLLAKDGVARFRAERQILASLNHPNIAKLIDGGSTDEQLPYLVLEYIDGLPIDRYCDEHKLTVAERLGLFTKVCAAVDFAHRNLVVHRDLKPNNILVDQNGEPKLLDFGIAKLLESHSIKQTIAVTREGTLLLTPEYASPEQVRGESPTIAADVYALGVLLYRMLTGESPYGRDITTQHDMEQAIVDAVPKRPSTSVTSEEISGRSKSHAQLRKQLSGDLDNIVLKALQKEPERRYASATRLSDDIERYLNHEPVQARPDSWRYRSGKFVRRHRRALSITAGVMLAAVALVSYYTWQLTLERDRANLAAAQSHEVTTFLQNLFNNASPHQSRGEQLSAVDLLDQGREQIELLDDQPRLQADLYQIIGDTYTSLGQLDASIELLTRAMEMKTAMPETSPGELSALHLDLSESNRQNDKLDIAEHHIRKAIEYRAQATSTDDPFYGYMLGRLGVILYDQQRPMDALKVEQQGLKIMEGSGDEHVQGVLDIMGNMANVYNDIGDYDKAAALYLEVLPISERVSGRHHPNTTIRLGNLANVYISAGRYQDALDVLEDAYARTLITWPDGHVQYGIVSLRKGRALRGLGRMDEALVEYRDMAETYRVVRGEDSARYATGLRYLAEFLIVLDRFDEANSTLQQALAINSAVAGEDDATTLRIRAYFGRLQLAMGRPEAAVDNLQAVLAKPNPQNRSVLIAAKRDMGGALTQLQRYEEALEHLEAALQEVQEIRPPGSPRRISYLLAVAENYRMAGDLDRALEYTNRAVAIADAMQTQNWESVAAYAEKAELLLALGRPDEAAPLFAASHTVWQSTFGDTHSLTRSVADR